jgi:hypothetical protein
VTIVQLSIVPLSNVKLSRCFVPVPKIPLSH